VPIRTHRGRAAVYRTFWGWPLRSPKHLIASVLVVSAIAVGIGVVLPDSRAASRPGPVAPSTTLQARPPLPAVPLATPGADPVGPPGPSSPRAAAPAAALAAARSWVQAFLTVPKGISSARWAEQLRPYTTDELLPELQSVDPANVPAARITGEPRTVSLSASSAEVDVPTSVVVVRLLMVSTPAGWRVAGYQRAG